MVYKLYSIVLSLSVWCRIQIFFVHLAIIMFPFMSVVMLCPKRMHSPGINGEGELTGQPPNPGSSGKMAVKTVCVCAVVTFTHCCDGRFSHKPGLPGCPLDFPIASLFLNNASPPRTHDMIWPVCAKNGVKTNQPPGWRTQSSDLLKRHLYTHMHAV